jgi:hypothetical protein
VAAGKEIEMKRRTRLTASCFALVLTLAMSLTSGAATGAVYPQGKHFLGFWDFQLFGIPYTFSFGDCIKITNKRILSATGFGAGTFTLLAELNDTQTAWEGRLPAPAWTNGGSIEITMGRAEKRGPGGVIAGVTYTRDRFFFPTLRYPGTVEGAQNSTVCPPLFP